MAKELTDRVAALERKLGIQAAARQPRTLIAEIEDVEKRIEAMGYMDDEVVLDEPVEDMSFMDDDDDLDDFDDIGEEPVVEEDIVDFMDMDTDMDEDYCDGSGPMMGSEREAAKPGVENDIDQDYLSEVVDLVSGGDSEVTNKSMLDTARSGSEERVALLKRASVRLDRVATHLEKTGRKKMAFKIDQISDAIDARIKGGRQ
jgi:hypothetical protein